MTKIAERIKELREDKKLTKIELGHKIGVSDVAIGYWERGRSEPNASCSFGGLFRCERGLLTG